MHQIYKTNLLKGLLNYSMDAFIVVDSQMKIIEWNQNAVDLFGWTSDEVQGRMINELIVPDAFKAFHTKKHTKSAHGYNDRAAHPFLNRRLEVPAIKKDGTSFPIELTVIPVDVDESLYFCASIRDLTDKKADFDELERRANLINLSRDGIYVVNEDHELILWNKGAEMLYGYTAEEAIGQVSYKLLNTDFSIGSSETCTEPFMEIIKDLMKNHAWEGELTQYTKTGEKLVVLSRWSIDPEKREILVTNTNITQIKNHAKQVEYLATHDELTGLPNRRLLEDRLSQAIALSHRTKNAVGVMLLDLDRFKVVNDSLGHDKGDLLLVEIAKRLRSIVREDDTVARLGGDEFVIILSNLDDASSIATVSKKIIDVVCKPVQISDHTEVTVGTSLGIAVHPQDGDNLADLLRRADLAMYAAKDHEAGSYKFFDEKMNVEIQKRLLNETDLRRALEKGEFILHYQPKICSFDGKTTGVEALIRWNHPTRGMISPAEFIPLAEEMGLINKIGEWALSTACHQNKAWQEMGKSPIQMSVNLSALQLIPDVVDLIRDCLSSSGLDPHWLDLEITESAAMSNVEATIETLNRIRELGVSLSIDDFGTGYSSLAHLKRMPLTCLKIDQSFVRGIPNDVNDISIVKSIIALAHSMNLKVIAEGVTDREQVAFLDTMKCDEMQGFLFSKPEEAITIEVKMIDHLWKFPYNIQLVMNGK